MKKIVFHKKTKSLIHCIIGVNVGWQHELDGKRGMIHFSEHAVFLGNKQFPFPDNIANSFGVELNGMTLDQKTLFRFTSLKEDFYNIFELFLSLIYHPDFDEAKLIRERDCEILSSVIKTSDYLPWNLARYWAQNLLFKYNILLSLGTPEDIKSLSINDLINWHNLYYHSENSFCVIDGEVDESELDKIIKKTNIRKDGIHPKTSPIKWENPEIYIKREKMSSYECVYGFKVPKYQLGLELLKIILGNNPASKLWNNNFKDYAGFESKLVNQEKLSGLFISFGITNKDGIEAIENNFFSLLNNFTISESELDVAKKILTIELLNLMESGESALLLLASRYPPSILKDFHTLINKIQSITVNDILGLVKSYLRMDNVYKSMVGP
jgi:predicted Zn-dependent peptidase